MDIDDMSTGDTDPLAYQFNYQQRLVMQGIHGRLYDPSFVIVGQDDDWLLHARQRVDDSVSTLF